MAHTPYMSVSWSDDVTEAQGWLVIDRLRRGVASGGLRMRQGCTLNEVRDLAAAMSLKEALVYDPEDRYQPIGGAKGGIDFDPTDPAAEGVLRRFLEAMRPLVESRWALGEDLGTRQSDIDKAVTGVGLRSCVHAVLPLVPDGPEAGMRRVDDAFAVQMEGLGLGDTVGGYGVAQAVLATLAEHGTDPATQTAALHGFGSMGGSVARYLARAGVKVTTVIDRQGVVVDDEGLDVELLLRDRTPDGLVSRAELPARTRLLDLEEWPTVPADILVTAATSYAVHADNQAELSCRYIVEAANVSVTPEAEAALTERGVTVIPDFLANWAANSWWWWTLFGDIPADGDRALEKIGSTMRRLIGEALGTARLTGVTPREAARKYATQHDVALRSRELDSTDG